MASRWPVPTLCTASVWGWQLCLELEKLKEKYEVIVRENEKLKTKEKIQ